MSSEYISSEINKIISNIEFEFPLNSAMAAAWILAHFKGVNIKIFNAQESTSLSDYFVIASVQNPTQARACVDVLKKELGQKELTVLSTEGVTDAEWILVDFGDIIVHIFQETARDVFDLDVLWNNYPKVSIPEEYYMNEKVEVEEPIAGPIGFF